MLEPRDYQQRSLDVLRSYCRATLTDGANVAFYRETNRPYRAVPQLPGLPYVCLRVPTGGGKTLMACHALAIATKELLQAERSACLWLVPSNAIREQTLAALRDRQHPYRQAIDAAFDGRVSVMDLTEALYVTRGTLAGDTCIIVATLAALRVTDTEGRKVYESSGALMDHFSGLTAELESHLERDDAGVVPKSLCNVLRLWRPVVIMDEAHNARTTLSFDTLARFNPSCIVEFTATPEMTHAPDRGLFASNILYHVSAAELKAEDMIKLPVKLETRAEWKEAIGEALRIQRLLEDKAAAEERETGEYLRPIVLFQAQSRSQTRETLTADVIRQSLIDDFQVDERQIAVATGQTRGVDDVDLFARDCPLRFIITVAALREGWDCSFAYVLCSVSEIASARAVEQVLGRILRLPGATKKQNAALNCAYAVVASRAFEQTLRSLKDAVIENGFQRLEAELYVEAAQPQTTFFEAGTLFFEAQQVVPEAPDLARLPVELQERLTFDAATSQLTVRRALSEQERDALADCFSSPSAREAVERLYHASHGRAIPGDDADRPRMLRIPAMTVRVDGERELFDESHFLRGVWRLSESDATLSEAEFPSEYRSGQSAEIDTTDEGRVEVRFIDEVRRQLSLVGIEPGWDLAGLTNWIDRRFSHPDLTRTESTLFIHRAIERLMETRRVSLDTLALQKFRLARAIEAKIDKYRESAAAEAYQQTLFGDAAVEIEVGPEVCFELSGDRYAARWYCEGVQFARHLFRLVGELQNEGEEFQCAVFIDQQLDDVKHWVRNLERRPDSFWLQTSSDKFYPDFVAELTDGRFLVVEYKGADRWSNDDSKEKRRVGELWADRSGGRCLFVMPRGPDFGAIRAAIQQ